MDDNDVKEIYYYLNCKVKILRIDLLKLRVVGIILITNKIEC